MSAFDVAERLADVPQRARPDLAVVVHLAVQVVRVVQVRVDAPQAVRDGAVYETESQSATHGSGSSSGTPRRVATTSETVTAQ